MEVKPCPSNLEIYAISNYPPIWAKREVPDGAFEVAFPAFVSGGEFQVNVNRVILKPGDPFYVVPDPKALYTNPNNVLVADARCNTKPPTAPPLVQA